MKVPEIKVSYFPRIPAKDRLKLKDSSSAASIAASAMEALGVTSHRECSLVIILNRSNAVLGWHLLSLGGITSTVIDPRLLFQAVLAANGTGFILAHNHPSGSLIPSNEDNRITSKIAAGASFLELQFLDHIIVSTDGYYSYADAESQHLRF